MMKVTYMGHSGFLLEMDRIYCMFDYYKGEFPKWDSGKKMAVFVSHAHYDHFGKAIFSLRKVFSEICFILSSDIPVTEYEDEGDVICAAPNESFDVFGMQVRTLRSNDQGVAYLLHGEGKTIYHAGDLNWWHWDGEPEEENAWMEEHYKKEIDRLAGQRFDAAFVPLDPRLGEQFGLGMDYFLEKTEGDAVFPMHLWEDYAAVDRYLDTPAGRRHANRIRRPQRGGQEWNI